MRKVDGVSKEIGTDEFFDPTGSGGGLVQA
jgi:hypothetical protein